MRPAAKREGGHGAMPSSPIGRKIYIFKRLDEIFLDTYATTPKKIISKKKGYLYSLIFFDELLFIYFFFYSLLFVGVC